MSDLITLRNISVRAAGDEGGEGGDAVIAEGIDTENPKSYSSRNMSASNLQDYAACLAYGLALDQLSLAKRIYAHYKELKDGDSGHFSRVRDDFDNTYTAQYKCAMSIAKQSVARDLGRKMYNALNTTDMYSSGVKRSIIEDTFATLVDESAPLVALAYRDEITFDDKVYLEGRANAVSSMEKSNMYVGASALSQVANTQVDLALFAADARNTQTLNTIDDTLKLITNAGNLYNAGENTLFKAKSETGSGFEAPSEHFGSQSPVRPDNPEGFTPNLPAPLPLPDQTGTSTGGEFTSTPGGVGGV